MSNKNKQHSEAIMNKLVNPQADYTPLVAVGEPKPKTGNGKATFKTASAAANAAREAREARDEARESEAACKKYAEICAAYIDKDIENTRKLLAALQRNEKTLIWCASISLGGFIGALVTTLIFSS